MSSLLSAASTNSAAAGSSNAINTTGATSGTGAAPGVSANGAQFREIHKNTWLKRLSADGKKYTVGPKKSECSWVVFCVHNDTKPLLEGYAEPRQAAAHMPEWHVNLRDTLHISHALIPNSHEFEFVVTLSLEVLRFHAASWEIMQEWVETLRSKLREMKILSPRENLYTKLPEVRVPLLPTRDPTSPLPAPPPVPAAIVPGVERVTTVRPAVTTEQEQQQEQVAETSDAQSTISATHASAVPSATNTGPSTSTPYAPAMSNTLTQNLLNMLSDPISTYSEQINETAEAVAPADAEASEIAMHDAQHSQIDENINLSDDEFLSPLLRKSYLLLNSNEVKSSLDQIQEVERLIPRLQSSRSQSAGAADNISKKARKCTTHSQSEVTAHNVTSTTSSQSLSTANNTSIVANEAPQDNITIIEVSNTEEELPPKLPPKHSGSTTITAEIFRFPDVKSNNKQLQQRPLNVQQQEYKSNVQIIPSNSSSIKVPATISATSISNAYTLPVKSTINTSSNANANTNTTMVHVLGNDEPEPSTQAATTTTVAVYGTCYPTTLTAVARPIANPPSTPKLSKKIILSANTSGVTNISVNSAEAENAIISGNVHYEKVFLSSSIPISSDNHSSSSNSAATIETAGSARVRSKNQLPSPRTRPGVDKDQCSIVTVEKNNDSGTCSKVKPTTQGINSPALPRRRLGSPTVQRAVNTQPAILTRGLTELVISTRPSRRDFHYLKLLNTPLKTAKSGCSVHKTTSSVANNNIENNQTPSSNNETPVHHRNNGTTNAAVATVSTAVESLDQRRRSSSTSDAQAPLLRSTRNANNNEFISARHMASGVFRIQHPPQSPNAVALAQAANPPTTAKRLTLREQQVMQLRREIMHPGGVRLNLRRKDCVGSIAWVDAFDGVWIGGWKQKEHPVLYNALHIGDQLLSIAGVSISSAAEANKIIRNTNTLFVELLLRRMPFGRAYAIRRDREGQCLGLIRDGNTSTIVDIVPNSLAARHGLPPKAQACDGSTLTFWMLTEINGRPLNLFFKDHEIRDRLNSVGRDISILVQPSDLITKLKKQLKSLRGYKDYLVE